MGRHDLDGTPNIGPVEEEIDGHIKQISDPTQRLLVGEPFIVLVIADGFLGKSQFLREILLVQSLFFA